MNKYANYSVIKRTIINNNSDIDAVSFILNFFGKFLFYLNLCKSFGLSHCNNMCN